LGHNPREVVRDPLDIVITLVIAYLLWRAVVPLTEWMFVDATFGGTTPQRLCTSGGGLLGVRARALRPVHVRPLSAPERWRVDLAGIILVASIAALSWKALPIAARLP